MEIVGLSAPVRVVRDRWGVPHIFAEAQDDLFFAQGFVQAQDRLFQMDLWRRAALGRLSEVLGGNFIDRDTMTRRVQYRGDLDREWASYAPDTKAIATAFVRGINTWVARARARPPEEFVRAGWLPAYWAPPDLLTRTDAFVASGDGLREVARAGLPDVVGDAIRSVGTAPFFVGSSGPPASSTAVRAVGRAAASAGEVTFSEATPKLIAPSTRYLVHLVAPRWNVIGAAAPWLPGVVYGHNDRVAWAMMPIDVDTQQIYVERVSTTPLTLVGDRIRVKGRADPLAFQIESTPRGVIVSTDREHGLAYAVGWRGFEPGAAAEMAATAIDRARTLADFRAALTHWKMPPRRFVFADADGHVAVQDAPSAGHAREARAEGAAADAIFAHVLGVTPAARRFNVGPLPRPADDGQVRGDVDVLSWDRSRMLNAPGQSAWRASTHYDDAAKAWSGGEMFPLVFSAEAISANAEATLTLSPKR
jgi:penicillin amidase